MALPHINIKSLASTKPRTMISEDSNLSLGRAENNQVYIRTKELGEDFIYLLHSLKANACICDTYYYQVGSIEKTQGWIIHLSVIYAQAKELMNKVLPYLLRENVAFKIPTNMLIIHQLNEGSLGSANLGKIVRIYPTSDQNDLQIVENLLDLTEGFRGPDIPTDCHLKGIIYTRYGSFNPIIKKNLWGLGEKYIYDSRETLIVDSYAVPFQYPENIRWPFGNIKDPSVSVQPKLLGLTFYPVETIKPDAKGRVIKALYFKRFYKISTCLIKEGKRNMFADESGRDIRDRLKWQFELNKDLYPHIPLPKLIKYIEQNDCDYLVMEFINGITMAEWIEGIYKENSWTTLSKQSKVELLAKFDNLLDIVEKLHNKGYIHRDLTPGNILIDNSGNLKLIDMELTWYVKHKYPNPPFKLGTPGYMSPQQEMTLTPTIEEDIFALGAFMITLFTKLHPLKLTKNTISELKENLLFLIGDPVAASLIFECLQNDPNSRPTLPSIRKTLGRIFNGLKLTANTISIHPTPYPMNSIDLSSTIKTAINGLTHNTLTNSEKCWLSRKSGFETEFGNQLLEMDTYNGWHTGMSGPLWVLAKVKHLGFDIESTLEVYENSIQYLKNQLCKNNLEIGPGLYAGKAGIAITLAEAIENDLLPANEENLCLLANCFESTALVGNLSSGIAGQGIALFSCRRWISETLFDELLNKYVEELLNRQLSNGAWPLYKNSSRRNIFTGISNGVAGIIWFLLASLEYRNDILVKTATERALTWLEKKSIKRGETYDWPTSSGTKHFKEISTSQGSSGIILTYIKAYKVLNNSQYKTLAKNWLNKLPDKLILTDFSLSSGLACLGEIYLEASEAFNEDCWKHRADWIAHVFRNTIQKFTSEQGYWITEDLTRCTADLFTGNSGILHFLLRHWSKLQLCHPLGAPMTMKKNCAQSGDTENLEKSR